MKTFLRFFICLLAVVLISPISKASPPSKSALPDCTVSVSQSVDVTTNTLGMLEFQFRHLKQSVVEVVHIKTYPLVTQLQFGFKTVLQQPPTTYIEQRINRLLPIPHITQLNTRNVNHYSNKTANNINNTCRHV